MLYLRPVPWLRWIGAAALILLALVVELRGPETVPHPFAATSLPGGAAVAEADLDYRALPAGVFPETELKGRLRIPVEAGTPLVPAMFEPDPVVPPDWWIVDVPLGEAAVAGIAVRLVVLDPPHAVTAVVVGDVVADPLSGRRSGPVAVPPASAESIARAAATDSVVTMVAAAASGVPDFSPAQP